MGMAMDAPKLAMALKTKSKAWIVASIRFLAFVVRFTLGLMLAGLEVFVVSMDWLGE